MFRFIPNKLALIVLISACTIILISMGLRQTFGLFFKAFEEGLVAQELSLASRLVYKCYFGEYLLHYLDI